MEVRSELGTLPGQRRCGPGDGARGDCGRRVAIAGIASWMQRVESQAGDLWELALAGTNFARSAEGGRDGRVIRRMRVFPRLSALQTLGRYK